MSRFRSAVLNAILVGLLEDRFSQSVCSPSACDDTRTQAVMW